MIIDNIIKKILITLTILLVVINTKAQNQKFEEGFVQVHKKKETVNPLLFENKGVAKPISIVPWKQKEILTIKKGTLLEVLAYEAKASIYYIYFVFIQNETGNNNSIEVYEVDYANHKPYKIFSYTVEKGNARNSGHKVLMKNGYLYFEVYYKEELFYYKYKYKLGEKLKVESKGYLEENFYRFFSINNHSNTAYAIVFNNELYIGSSDSENKELEFVIKGFENSFDLEKLSWSIDDKILYFDNYASGFACIWRYNTESKELSKIIPEHEAEQIFAFTYNYKEYVFYIEKNTIKIATSKKKASVPKKTDPISAYEKSKIQTLVTHDFEVAEIKKSSDRLYTYVTGTTQENDTGLFHVVLVEDMKKIVSRISMEMWLGDYVGLEKMKKININGIDEAFNIYTSVEVCGYGESTVLFYFRKKDKLIKSLQLKSFDGEEGYKTSKIVTPKNLPNQVWIEYSEGGYDTETSTKRHHFTNIKKYKFQNDSLVLMNPKPVDNYYYVTAKNGLNTRNSPYFSNDNIIEVLDCGTKVKVLNKTDFTHELWDGSKKIKGRWVQVEIKNNGKNYTAYIFDGYLSKELVNINTAKETNVANGEWKWYYANQQLGELGFYKNGKKDGLWKWYFKNGELKATGTYKDGQPVGTRKWYYSDNYNEKDLYCIGQYSNGKKDGEWKWYYNKDKLKISIRFNKDTIVQYAVFDRIGKLLFKNKGSNTTKVIFEESYMFLDVFDLKIEDPNAYNISFNYGINIGKRKNNKAEGEWKIYSEYGNWYTRKYYKDGLKSGKWKTYRNDGTLYIIKNYKNGKLNGEFKQFTEKEELLYLWNYISGENKGLFEEYYDNGQVKNSGYIENDKQVGKWKFYYKNGQVKNIRSYKNGKIHGEWTEYNLEGKLKKIIPYKNGKIHGKWIEYNLEGNLKEITPYKNDKIHGKWTEYNEDGILIKSTLIKDGNFKNLHQTYFYTNGQIRRIGSSNNGVWKFGEWKSFYSNGELKEINNYKDGKEHGKWKKYYENGQLKGQGQYIKDEADGKFIWYKEDGKIKSAIEYKYPYEVGKWKYYKNGQLKSVELYQRDELVEWKYYYDNGQLKEVRQYYKKGTRTGKWKYYYKSGQLRKLAQYKDEKPYGEFKLYHENGQLYKTQVWKYYKKLLEVNSCFDAKGNALDIGTLKNGNGIVKEYNASGELINIAEYIDGKTKHNISLDNAWNDSSKLNTFAWTIYKKETDKVKLDFAIKWVKRSIKLDENYHNTDTYAALLYKKGKYKQALTIAEKAITMAKKMNVKFRETEDLIEKIKLEE